MGIQSVSCAWYYEWWYSSDDLIQISADCREGVQETSSWVRACYNEKAPAGNTAEKFSWSCRSKPQLPSLHAQFLSDM